VSCSPTQRRHYYLHEYLRLLEQQGLLKPEDPTCKMFALIEDDRRVLPSVVIVHILNGGTPMCGAHPGQAPAEWPLGERWTPWIAPMDSNCPGCLEGFDALVGQSRYPYQPPHKDGA
jgi:hypothetical protein